MFKRKTFTLLAFTYFLFSFVFTTTLCAQTPSGGGTEDFGLIHYFFSIPAMATLVILATQFVKKLFQLTGNYSQYASFILALAFAYIGWFFEYGIFVGVMWYYIFIYGMASALIANGLFDWNFIKVILVFLKLKTGEKNK